MRGLAIPKSWKTANAGRVSRAEPYIAAVLVIAATCVFVAEALRMKIPVVDDAAITLSYARTFFAGGGARLTFASARVEGFSDPLWLVLSGLAFPLHRDPLAFTQHVSIAFGALAVMATAGLGFAQHGRPLRLEDAAAPWILCWMPTFAFWAAEGMETCLYGLLLTTSVLLALWEERTGKSSWTGLSLALLCLTRPEAPIAIAAIALFWMVARLYKRQRPGKQELRIVLWVGLVFGAYLAIRWWYFARLLPNTYYAKRWWDYAASDYMQTFCETYPRTVLGVAIAALVVSVVGDFTQRLAIGLLFLVLAGGVEFVLLSKGDWMPEWRFCAPFCPIFAMTIASTAIVVRQRANASGAVGQAVGALAAFLLTLGLLYNLYGQNQPRFALVAASPALPAENEVKWSKTLADFRDATGLVHARFGIPDVGGTALMLPNDAIVDVAGLADYPVAEHVEELPAEEDYLLNEGLPDIVDAHGQSGRLTDPVFATFMGHYERWKEAAWVVKGLTKDKDPRCPRGLARVKALPLADFLGEMQQAISSGDGPLGISLWRCGQEHRTDNQMPDKRTQAALHDAAHEAAKRATDAHKKLRLRSLATILSNEDAHERRATEILRAQLYPTTKP